MAMRPRPWTLYPLPVACLWSMTHTASGLNFPPSPTMRSIR